MMYIPIWDDAADGYVLFGTATNYLSVVGNSANLELAKSQWLEEVTMRCTLDLQRLRLINRLRQKRLVPPRSRTLVRSSSRLRRNWRQSIMQNFLFSRLRIRLLSFQNRRKLSQQPSRRRKVHYGSISIRSLEGVLRMQILWLCTTQLCPKKHLVPAWRIPRRMIC